MAIYREQWVKYILGNLFKDNPHLEKCFSEDDFVLGGRIVHIPQAGSKPDVEKNRTVFPAVAVKRTDVDIVYPLDSYTTDPTHIQNAEEVELSYSKMDSVIGEHIATLREYIGDDILYKWVSTYADQTAAATIYRTTGGAVGAHLDAATGNRKLFLKEDLKKARLKMNKDNISKSERYALIPSDMLDQLTNDADLKVRDNALELDMRSGSIGRLYGFEILERSSTAVYNNAATPVLKALGAAGAATDNDSVVCWQKNAVARALGEIDFFEDLQNPLYYGDVYSAEVRMGGRSRRKDGKGLVIIVQDASA